ncbi:nuclear transport factor 2 family protein [Actinoplanes sp. NPDC051470]|uniref:nuclear transport factor 2 family protein n=1 Tax=unclassified Actinoplanes TaxID=2626549 RepID=UPI003431890F
MPSPFKEAIDRGDIESGVSLLAPDVVFHSPVLRKPFHGVERVGPLLAVLWNTWEGFRYTKTIGSSESKTEALLFEAQMLDQSAQGVTLLTWQDGRIEDFTVMVRPFRAARAILQALDLDPERA